MRPEAALREVWMEEELAPASVLGERWLQQQDLALDNGGASSSTSGG